MLDFSLKLGWALTASYSWALFRASDPATQYQLSPSLHDPFNPGLSMRLHLQQWLLLVSPGARSQLLSTTSSWLHNQSELGNIYTLPIWTASTRHNLGLFWTIACVCWPRGNISRNILPQWCWSLNHNWVIIPRCKVLIVPAKQRFHFSGASLLITTDASSLAGQNHKFLIQIIT